MSEQSPSPPLLRPAVIFTAIYLAFYFLMVWNPIGTYGDVRGYLEYRVLVPIEWIMAFFAVSLIIQRNSSMRAVAVVLPPVFIVILAITRPDYGASFWEIFRHEIYLPPVYVPRGLLIYLAPQQNLWVVFYLIDPMELRASEENNDSDASPTGSGCGYM
ncbi:MAG: hypothetical protein ACREYE_01275, partial [Gammaproteobacteria bacterium]